jgi:hypothetical protein
MVKKTWRGLVMRHTAGTRWIEEADARQMVLDAASRAHPNDRRRAVKSVLRTVVIAVPLALAVIGSTALLSNSGSPAHIDCSGFPAVACHPVHMSEM